MSSQLPDEPWMPNPVDDLIEDLGELEKIVEQLEQLHGKKAREAAKQYIDDLLDEKDPLDEAMKGI